MPLLVIVPRLTYIFTQVDDAMFLIDKVRPKWTERQMQEYLNITIQDGLSKGLVGIHDGGVVPDHVDFFQRYVRLWRWCISAIR